LAAIEPARDLFFFQESLITLILYCTQASRQVKRGAANGRIKEFLLC
jgi:hypothetical protein